MRKWKVPDWENPFISAIYPEARDRVGWYDSTPGFAPRYRKLSIPVGAVVRVNDPLLSGPGWVGRIAAHTIWTDGTYSGLALADCLNTRGFLDKRDGSVDQVEISDCQILLPSVEVE